MTLDPPNDEQQKIIDHLHNTDRSVFITGKAGTGKSHVLKHYQAAGKHKIIVSASTGVAALGVDGKTVHRMLGLGTALPADLYTDVYKLRSTHGWLKNFDVLVVDEISMISSDLMDAMDRNLQIIRGNHEPFGGMRMVMFGDPYQLPPVVTDDFKKYLKAHKYRSEWFFDAKVWQKDTSFDTFSLEQIQRQRGDEQFTHLLNAVRDGSITSEELRLINIVGGMNKPTDNTLLLAGYNRTVFDKNTNSLASLPGKTYTYEAKVSTGFGRDEPAERVIHLKPGAKVIMLTNDGQDRWVNGTVGVVTTCADSWVTVEIDGERYNISPHPWIPSDCAPENFPISPKYIQLPMKLAWAVTVHKSQGMTKDEIEIDLGAGAFSPGQTYVALSRVTSASGLVLTHPLAPSDIKVDTNVARFFKNIDIEAT